MLRLGLNINRNALVGTKGLRENLKTERLDIPIIVHFHMHTHTQAHSNYSEIYSCSIGHMDHRPYEFARGQVSSNAFMANLGGRQDGVYLLEKRSLEI